MTNIGCSMSPGPGLSPGQQPYLQQSGMNHAHLSAVNQPGLAGGAFMSPIPPASPPSFLPPTSSASGPSMRDLLTEYLGRYIRTEHLVGTNSLVNHEGRLIRVCENAFVLEEQQTGFHQVCDYYSLKFFREL